VNSGAEENNGKQRPNLLLFLRNVSFLLIGTSMTHTPELLLFLSPPWSLIPPSPPLPCFGKASATIAEATALRTMIDVSFFSIAMNQFDICQLKGPNFHNKEHIPHNIMHLRNSSIAH
jgi:hypothetical protein